MSFCQGDNHHILSGRVGGSGRLELSLWTAPIGVRIHFFAIGSFSPHERGMRDGKNLSHSLVETTKGFWPFDAFG